MKLNQFLKDQTGVTGIEYALIAGGISMGIVLVVSNIGSTLAAFFTSVESGLGTSG
jgi:pilus assembly protein Flp/PilA